jgi:hypothetical protein
VGGLALIASAVFVTTRPADDRSDFPQESLSHEASVAAEDQRPDQPLELPGTDFVVPSSYSSLHAAGRCQRGQVQAFITPNRPFRSLTAMVIDVPAEGRIRRRYELFVDAIDGEIIDGHFSDGDRCTLRLVGPGGRGPVDPVVPTNTGNV